MFVVSCPYNSVCGIKEFSPIVSNMRAKYFNGYWKKVKKKKERFHLLSNVVLTHVNEFLTCDLVQGTTNPVSCLNWPRCSFTDGTNL
jgi:hypothetical protein